MQISENEKNPLIDKLLEIIAAKDIEIKELRDENDDLFNENIDLQEEITKKKIRLELPINKNPDLNSKLETLNKLGVFQYERMGPITPTEERHLTVQSIGMALCILSGNKIGIEDLCRHPAMIKLNPWYFQPGIEKKQNTVKQLLREVVPSSILKKGRKKNGYFAFHTIEGWRDSYKCNDTYSYYKNNKPLPNVFQYNEGKVYLDIFRVQIVLNAWCEMVKEEFIHESFFHNDLCLGYFNGCKYILGHVWPNSMFADWFDEF